MNKNTTHRNQTDVIDTVLQLLLDSDQNALAEGFRLMVNEAMKAERSYALNAAPYERSDERLGYANGFKPKTVATRLGPLTFQVPQVRGDIDFYPSALERGLRSERARTERARDGADGPLGCRNRAPCGPLCRDLSICCGQDPPIL